MDSLVRSRAESVTINIGGRVIGLWSDISSFLNFTRYTITQMVNPPFRRRLLFQQMEFIGNDSLVIIMISGFFIGAVFGLQIGMIFRIFGAEGMLGAATIKAMTRELSPLMGGFLLAGRTGAAMTAEISTMKVNEQVDAMESMAVDPVSYLVVPRFIAGTIMLPILVGIFTFMGSIGVLVVGIIFFDVDQGVFFDKMISVVEVRDIFDGMVKAVIFGGVIVLSACKAGLSASGGAKGVGQATTRSVVNILLIILAIDFFVTYIQVNV